MNLYGFLGKMIRITAYLMTIYVAGKGTAMARVDLQSECEKIIAAKGESADSTRLKQLFDICWEYRMHEYPTWATSVGYPGQNDRWSDLSREAIDRRDRELRFPLEALATIDKEKLNQQDRISYDLFKNQYDENIESASFPGELLRISQMGGVQQDAAATITSMPTANKQNYDNILARMHGIPGLIDQNVALMKEGLEKGITPPRITIRDVPGQIQNQIVDDAAESPFWEPFREFPETIAENEQEELRSEATKTIKNEIVPAFQRLHRFFVEEYLPHTRESIAMGDLPDGDSWYAFRVRQSTTTDLSPEEIHEIGKAEVARIRAEMEEIISESGFEGSFVDFLEFLRTDRRFFYDRPEDLLTGYRDICKRIDSELIRLFGILPRLPYGVKKVPEYAEKSQTTAYYQPGSLKAGRPGWYYANTYDLKSRPKWEMEALSLHEAVPGHHLQISIAQELEDLPEFRKYSWITAYGEGWALYAESLGDEIGLYKDPYSRFGQLTYEMWRAIRLVVDPGIHALGWNRNQAIEFFKENSSKTEHDIIVEVDRYIVWPGQAVAYKIGELKIKELRRFAKAELGGAFDIRAFHDVILGSGCVPLTLLEQMVKNWVAGQKTAGKN
jgi:uncharacterized protein (DUF885 family)